MFYPTQLKKILAASYQVNIPGPRTISRSPLPEKLLIFAVKSGNVRIFRGVLICLVGLFSVEFSLGFSGCISTQLESKESKRNRSLSFLWKQSPTNLLTIFYKNNSIFPLRIMQFCQCMLLKNWFQGKFQISLSNNCSMMEKESRPLLSFEIAKLCNS